MTAYKPRKSATLAVIVALLISGFAPFAQGWASAQVSPVVITLGVPSFLRDGLEERAIKDFESANPGIKVQIVNQETVGAPFAANGLDSHLNAAQKLASLADVSYIQGSTISAESTRAGYFLNLKPLIESDKDLNQADFLPTLWRSYEWDQGFWAIPLGGTPYVLSYDPVALDKAGVAYPTNNWTIDDLINAVKKLNVVDSTGKVTTPGIELYIGFNDVPLLMSLLGKPLADPNAIPNPPQLDTPETVALLTKLKELQDLLPKQQPEFGTAPLRIEQIFSLTFRRPQDGERKGVLLPGGRSYMDVSAVAVSGASLHPNEAYKLAKYLSGRAELARLNGVSARRTITGEQGGLRFGGNLAPELQTLQDQAIELAYTPTDRRFFDYLSNAVIRMSTQNLDASGALQVVQQEATKNQQLAFDRKSDQAKVAIVATPVPISDPNKGITLKFGVTSFSPQLAKRNEINALAEEFVRNTPGVARVDIQTGFQRAEQAADRYDCFYLPYSAVPSIQLNKILSLDPYVTTDKDYSATNYIGGAIQQVSRDGKVWALPMGISPTVMWFDPTSFANAGLPKPAYGWSINGFKDTLTSLKVNLKEGQTPFKFEGAGGAGVSLLMLISAYGGTPIDWSTTPPTVKLTDPKNADAMRQVLDLAKAGLLKYDALGATFGIVIGGRNTTDNPLYSEQLNGLNFRAAALFAPAQNASPQKFEAVTFPKGTSQQAISYSSGSLYISSKAQNADACYKWIKLFASKPELLDLMPAQRATLADSAFEAKVGKALATVYRDVAQVLDEQGTIAVPSLFDGGANIAGFVVQYWLFEAWDNYVLKNGDLDQGLRDAQVYVDAYYTCQSGLPAYDPAQQKYEDYIAGVIDCAVKADPRLKALLGRR